VPVRCYHAARHAFERLICWDMLANFANIAREHGCLEKRLTSRCVGEISGDIISK
jgi:hypothetical protein